MHGEELSAPFGGLCHLVKRRHGHFHRLFADDALSGLQRPDYQLLMAVVGGHHSDRLYTLIPKNFLKRSVGVNAGALRLLLLYGVNVIDTGQDSHVAF